MNNKQDSRILRDSPETFVEELKKLTSQSTELFENMQKAGDLASDLSLYRVRFEWQLRKEEALRNRMEEIPATPLLKQEIAQLSAQILRTREMLESLGEAEMAQSQGEQIRDMLKKKKFAHIFSERREPT